MTNETVKADETAVEETETEVEETPEETTTTEVNDSEVEPTEETENTTEETGRGDLRVPLKEEREKRRQLEEQLAQVNSPEYVAQKAREFGWVDENDQVTPATETKGQNFDFGTYQYFRSLEKAQEKYPDLVKHEEDQTAITTIMQRENISPEKAADKFYSRFNKLKEEAKAEGATQAIEQKNQEETEKARAQTVNAGTSPTSEQVELEELTKASKSLDRKTQDAAMIELLKRKNKGI